MTGKRQVGGQNSESNERVQTRVPHLEFELLFINRKTAAYYQPASLEFRLISADLYTVRLERTKFGFQSPWPPPPPRGQTRFTQPFVPAAVLVVLADPVVARVGWGVPLEVPVADRRVYSVASAYQALCLLLASAFIQLSLTSNSPISITHDSRAI